MTLPIVIGHQTDYELHGALAHLCHIERLDLVRLLTGERDDYDMAVHPDKGDALDAITAGTPLVVAFNIYGIGLRDRPDPYAPKVAHFYNRNNHELLPLCEKLGVPLLVLGDQPKGPPCIRLYDTNQGDER
jgi:hypothetical protein